MDVAYRIATPWSGVIRRIVAHAIDEDLGRGDVTTDACVPPGTRGEADVRARKPMVVSGLSVLREVFEQVDPDVEVFARCKDGEVVPAGANIAHLTGPAASILKGERVALNFVQRMSGIATQARKYVEAIPQGSKTRIADTRKTTPGLRALERYAVRCGGAHNHREDLSAAVLIKDNHIAAAGGLAIAVERARQYAPHTSRIECEVDSLEQLQTALDCKVEVVMLDNFGDEQVRTALDIVAGRALVEVSGGITLERVTKLAELGVDVISVGALTHSSAAIDIGLDWARKA